MGSIMKRPSASRAAASEAFAAVRRRAPRSAPRRSAALAAASLCAAIAALAIAPATAFAERTYDSHITGLASPWGVAIDSGDHVWVSQPESGGGLISEFSPYPSQTLEGKQTGGGHYNAYYIRSLALDNASGDLLVADSGPVVIDVFENGTGAFVERFEHAFGSGYLYVAADSSGGASNGRFYVSATSPKSVQAFEANRSPHEFSDTGASYISGNAITGTPSASFSRPWNIAVDNSGNIYVIEQTKDVVDEFRASGEFVQEVSGASVPGGFGEVTGVAVDPTNGDILVVDARHEVVDEFDASGTYLSQLTGTGPSEEAPFAGLHGGIAVNSGGYVYVSDAKANVVDIFTSAAILPKVTYGTVANQAQTSGELNASVDLNGGPEVSSCEFQYGTTIAYGSSVPCSPGTPYTTNTSVSATISGLTPETTYHYRLVLTTANGTKKASDQTYIPHAVAGLTTDAATNVARNTTTLNAHYNGNGEDTHYYFEWGPTTSYGNTTPMVDEGSGSGSQGVSAELTGLTVETTYHFRVVASNSVGTSYGDDESFKTLAAVENLQTEAAANVTASSATLEASYNGIGEDVHYYFEWGPTTSYGNTTSIPPGLDAGSGSGPQALSFELEHLEVDSTVHYRVIATDAAGVTHGGDRSFTTLGRYQFSSDLGSAGSGDGQLSNPRDLAVDDSTGDIYVADTGNHRIIKLNESGHFLAAWGWGVGNGNPESEICTSGCQAGIAGQGAGQFTAPRFVEVDNSPGPSSGDVYVADTADSVVQKFDPSGNLIASWGTGGAINFSSPGGTIGGITVDTAGDLFVLTDNAPYVWTELGQDGVSQRSIPTDGSYGEGDVDDLGRPGGTGIDVSALGAWYELQSAGGGVFYSSPTAEIYASWDLYGRSVPAPVNSGIAIDRATNDVYVDQGSYIDQFSGSTKCGGVDLSEQGCGPVDTFGSGDLTGATGLAFDPRSNVIYAANSGANDIASFTPLPVPAVTTGEVTDPGPTSGTLTGRVDPDGPGTISSCYFEYGTEAKYDLGSIPCAQATPLGGPTEVSASLTGLSPYATYHYRLVAIRSDGRGFPSYGRDQTFTPSPGLAPSIGETEVVNVTPTTATLSGKINPNQSPTVFRFQYGANSSYGNETIIGESIGEDAVDHTVTETIEELQPATTYHFRLVALNFDGTTYGPDQTFTTPAPPALLASGVSDITETSATLDASIQPGFRATTYHFEYGSVGSNESSTAESASIGSDNIVHSVSTAITGLSSGSVYRYRLVASNAVATVQGPEQTFSTRASEESTQPTPSVPCAHGLVKREGRCLKRHVHRHRHKKSRRHVRRGRR